MDFNPIENILPQIKRHITIKNVQWMWNFKYLKKKRLDWNNEKKYVIMIMQ